IVSAVQVSEAVRVITGQKPMLLNKLLYIDLRQMEFNILPMSAVASCAVCGVNPAGPPEKYQDRLVEETCARDGRRNFIISPKARIEINLEKLKNLLSHRNFRIENAGLLGITFEASDELKICLLKSGIMIAQTSPEVQNNMQKGLFDLYTSLLVDGLGFSAAILPADDLLSTP
ncbi:MAG: hypothetical protein JSW39_14780, partial [Desulfobacterales bacterium]